MRHTARRLEHLASLRIPVAGKTVIDVGAGIGDHLSYYLDRGCVVSAIDARPEIISFLQKKYPQVFSSIVDVEADEHLIQTTYNVVHCYGLLYHVSRPERVIRLLSSLCSEVLFLETCVSLGIEGLVQTVPEDKRNPSQAYRGTGSRPTRQWVFDHLKEQFPYVYVPQTQPNHEEFPLVWNQPSNTSFTRAIFIASRFAILNELLLTSLPSVQFRHE